MATLSYLFQLSLGGPPNDDADECLVESSKLEELTTVDPIEGGVTAAGDDEGSDAAGTP
jgi:hypothetical protein